MEVQCKNCETAFEGKFCPNCGQKAKTGRITFRQIYLELRSHFLHFDRGFAFTILQLATRPGAAVREYLAGKRVNHVKPLKFLFWSAAVSIIFSSLINLENRLYQSIEKDTGKPISQASRAMGHSILEKLQHYPGLVALMTIPTLSLCSWLLFRKRGYNYAEHFTANTYFMGEITLFGILLSLTYVLIPNLNFTMVTILGSVQWLCWSAYFGWAYSGWMLSGNRLLKWIKGILSLIGGYLLLILIFSVLMSTFLYIFHENIKDVLMKQDAIPQ